jgi:NAD(P)-dependent dehydrogenase (short-subunit alcohol dehydrogenase family)
MTSSSNESEQRCALVTGASRGLGLAIAKALAADGVKCLLLARDHNAVRAAAEEILGLGGNAEAIPLDLGGLQDAASLSSLLAARTDRLDIVVSNAALGGIRTPMTEYPADLWQQVFQVNVHSTQVLLAATYPFLLRSPAGRIVVLSTGVARKWKAHTGAYAVSKAAVEAMVQIYALEQQDTHICINVVNPGPTRTEMRADAFPAEDPLTLKTPEDIAPLFVELCSASCAARGQVINADEWISGKAA